MSLERHLAEAGSLELIKILKRLDDGMRLRLKEALNESEKNDDESSTMFGNLGWDDRFDDEENPIPAFLGMMDEEKKKPPQEIPTPIGPKNPTPTPAPIPAPTPAPGPMPTPGMLPFSFPAEEVKAVMEPLLLYLVDSVIRISTRSVFYDQEEVLSLLDLVSLEKADIFGIVDRAEKDMITRSDARLLQQLTWWYTYTATGYTDQDIPEKFWWDQKREDFLKFKKTKAHGFDRSDMNLKGTTGRNPDEEQMVLFNKSLKLDISQFPEFNGQLQSWLYWKRKFLSMAKCLKLGVVLKRRW